MNNRLFDINNFNIIQVEENYYFFRALNMADNSDIEQNITTQNGNIERIRTDRERYNGETKYTEDSEISLEELYDHIKMHYRKDTNCISLTSNANVAVNYGRGSYKDKYVMIKIPKKEFGEKSVVAGQYMITELYSIIEQAIENLPDEKKKEILEIFDDIDNADENKSLKELIAKRYTSKSEGLNPNKAHLRKGIKYASPKARISSYQALDEKQLLEVNKVYAKLAILENEHILEHVIPDSSNSKLRETIGNAFSSSEVIHYGDIKQQNILEIPKEVVDIFALIQQVDGIDKNKVEKLKQALIIAVQKGKQIPQIPEIDFTVKSNISIEEMYEITEGKVEYGKANSIVKNMFYLSKSRKNAIVLADALSTTLGDNSGFEDIIQSIRENGFRIEPEIISRKTGQGVRLSESVNLNLDKEEQTLISDIKKLSSEELEEILRNGGLSDIQNIVNRTYGNESNPIDKSRYYAEAIISQYDWQEIGIEEFKATERNELIKRLQDRNCIEIYNTLKQIGIKEKQIPRYLLNIATRQGLYERFLNGELEQLLNENREVLQGNLNIEVIERFLGYYDLEGTDIKLKDYQQRAFDNVNKIFESHKFAQVILPTGAGKSFVALAQMQQYVKEHPNEKMLYLAPQDEILNQIKNYIVKYVHGKKDTVGKSVDEIVEEVFSNITFETYSGLLSKRGQKVVKDQYGMIVLDELHRTGAKEWEGKIDSLFSNQEENVKVLGITATPVRDVDGRDMAEENARKLGYTDEEMKQRKHLASNMTLENAIRMGYVVNPKIVYCKYDLISSGQMEKLRAKIDNIEDDTKRAEELQKYYELRARLNKEIDAEIGEEGRKKLEEEGRKNLDSGIGKEEILREHIKKGGKYIVFIPVSDQGEIEDEDGNRIGTKTGEDKLKAYQDYLNKVFEGTDIVPQCHAMSGSWNGKEKNNAGEDKNQQELNAFESDNSEETKFMVVMNKANEGLHIEGVDGIIWFRALDENSRILYLQQLGRAIYALDEDNPLPDDKRPIVIDLANNSLTVKIEKEFENSEPIDDLEALIIVKEWIEQHNGMLPDKNSSNKQEQHYYAVLRRIQSKYSKYLDGFDNFEDLSDEQKDEIQQIIDLVTEIDLWNIDLPPIPKARGSKDEMNPFEISGVLKDYVEFKNEIDNFKRKNTYEEIIEWLETHDGQMPQSTFITNGERKDVAKLTEEEHYQVKLMQRWRHTDEYNVLKEYEEQPIESVPEKYREKISKLREYGLGLTTYKEIIEWLKTHNGKMPQSFFSENGEQKNASELTEDEKYQSNLMDRWYNSEEYKVLTEYRGKPIEDVPKEYRKKISLLRDYGLGLKEKTPYEEIIEWLETHNGQMPQGSFSQNGKKKISTELTEDEKYQSNLLGRWRNTEEYKVFTDYKEQPIENVPEEYKEKIEKLRKLIKRKPRKNEETVYTEIIEWLETHDGQMPKGSFFENGEKKISSELTENEKYQSNLMARWRHTEIYSVLTEYREQPIENLPEEYRGKIARLRELIREKQTVYEEIIGWLETHDGQMPQNRKDVSILTEEESYEVKLRRRWYDMKEYKVFTDYKEQPIENVPEEYREKIAMLRGLIKEKKTPYEEIIEWLETHDGKMPQSCFSENGKQKNVSELAEDEKYQRNLMSNWRNTEEYKLLIQYTGKTIEDVPEEYRKKISVLREYGLGLEEKMPYEEIIEWLETHDGKMPQSTFRKNGNKKKSSELTAEEKYQKNLMSRWYNTEEYKLLIQYTEQPIEDVPEEYREKIAKLRRLGLGMKKSKLQQAKQQRDEAKNKNVQAKELEEQVAEQFKKRGKKHEEQ